MVVRPWCGKLGGMSSSWKRKIKSRKFVSRQGGNAQVKVNPSEVMWFILRRGVHRDTVTRVLAQRWVLLEFGHGVFSNPIQSTRSGLVRAITDSVDVPN